MHASRQCRVIPRLITLAALLLGTAPVGGVTFSPIVRLSSLGGQYYTGSTHASGVNVDSSFVPVIGLTPRLYLIPIYLGTYHETQSVYNFLGETTLIQRQLDQSGTLRLDWAVSPVWRLKPRAGYKREWTKQSTDEGLGNGLFNYDRIFGGVSGQMASGGASLELGFEYNKTRFPNYQALSADPRLTSTGITANAGTDVLNYNSYQASLTPELKSGDKRWLLNGTFTWIRQNFVDQKVITTTTGGLEDFLNEMRTDDIYNLSVQQSFRSTPSWVLGLGETIQYYTSNQNAFDASQVFSTPFTFHYYNFIEPQVSPSISLLLDESRWELTLAGSYAFRQYAHRRTQDSSGAFQNELIHTNAYTASLTVRYRLLKGLYTVLTGSFLKSTSNMNYEVNYPYNYTNWTYLGGMSWEFPTR